ncbi:MAG: pyrroline-5-carboxylate reductase [Pseudomonadota bacterium]
MQDQTIGFIGGGNMARSLVGGLIADGVPAENIRVADPGDPARHELTAEFAVATQRDNAGMASCDVLVLAVKPQILHTVLEELADELREHRPLVISVAAGARLVSLTRWMGDDTLPLVRAMPNTPALVQSAATGLCANAVVTDEQRALAEAVLRAVGITLWVEDESLLDAVTAISGSGPAYFFLFMEALEEAGERMGLNHEQAQRLAVQTAFGAARMALESPDDPAELRRGVTSPGGTTERALEVFDSGNLRALVAEATEAARARADELANLLDEH